MPEDYGYAQQILQAADILGIDNVAVAKLGTRGRLTIPAKIRTKAEITDRAVVTAYEGDDYFEVWGENTGSLRIRKSRR